MSEYSLTLFETKLVKLEHITVLLFLLG